MQFMCLRDPTGLFIHYNTVRRFVCMALDKQHYTEEFYFSQQAVTMNLTMWPELCFLSAISWSSYAPNLSEIKQSAAELQRLKSEILNLTGSGFQQFCRSSPRRSMHNASASQIITCLSDWKFNQFSRPHFQKCNFVAPIPRSWEQRLGLWVRLFTL